MEYHFKVKRFNPEKDEKPHWEEYTVEANPNDRVLDGLDYIKWYHDGTLTLRRSCAHGVCGSDAMVINGRTRLACKLLMQVAAQQSDPVTVEALRGFPIVKDLVVNMDFFLEKFHAVKPYLINEEPVVGERLQSQQERARFDDTTKCILCGACTASCPTFWADKNYISPAMIVQAHRFIFDCRDDATQERLEMMQAEGGVFTCRSIYNCAEACPRGIDVVKAINEVRQAILFGRR